MQSTNTHWAGAETSVTKTSSTANRDQPQRVTITRNNMDCNIVMANQLNDETNLSDNLVPINNTKPWVGPRYNKKEDNQIYKFSQGHAPCSPQEFRRTNHQPTHPYCPRDTLVVKTTHVNRVRCYDLEISDSDKQITSQHILTVHGIP